MRHTLYANHVLGWVVVTVALLLSACFGAFEAEYVGPATIEQQPPAPRVEAVPSAPDDDAVWMYGYWNWTGVTYVWIPGRYVHRPAAGLYWYPGGYVRRGSGYIYVHGRWGARAYQPRHQYVYPRRYPRSGGGYYRRSRGRR